MPPRKVARGLRCICDEPSRVEDGKGELSRPRNRCELACLLLLTLLRSCVLVSSLFPERGNLSEVHSLDSSCSGPNGLKGSDNGLSGCDMVVRGKDGFGGDEKVGRMDEGVK